MGHLTDQDSDSISSDFQSRDDANIKSQPNKKHKCSYPDCHAVFLRPSRLERHIRSHTGEKPYTCSHAGCTKSYTNSSHLKRHLETHNSTKKTYRCTECSKIISNLHNLKRHLKQMHSEDKKISCGECGETFNKRHQLATHQTIHFGPTVYKCDKCTKTFMNLNRFKRHKKTHENAKRYPCSADECSEVFDKWLLLQAHRKAKHSGYKCEKCNKIFRTKSQLTVHSKIHSENRMAIPCSYEGCSRSYLSKFGLEQHVNSSHLGNKFYCDICSAGFTTKRKLILHIQRHDEPKERKSPTKIQKKKRKDAGIPKKSAITKLIGMDLPNNLEKMLIERETITNSEVSDKQSNDT